MDPAELIVSFNPVTELRSAHWKQRAGDYVHLIHDGEIVMRIKALDFQENPKKALGSLREGLVGHLSGDWTKENAATRFFLAGGMLVIDDAGEWISIQDNKGEEVVYWACEEFAESPHEVIGALMGAIAMHQPSNRGEFSG